MRQGEWLKNIDIYRIFWIVLCALLVIVLFHSLNRFFDHDELEAIHTSWKMLQGEKIYVDFLQHHHPLLYYLLIPVIGKLGENIQTIITIRLLIFVMLLLILFVSYLLAKNIFNREIGIISLLLLSTTVIFVLKAIEIRPNVPETFFALSSIFFLFFYFKKRGLLYLVLSAFSLGIAFLFFQLALFLIIFIGCFLLFDVYKRLAPFRDLLLYFSVFLLVLLPYGIYLFYTNSFNSYFQLNWILNMKFLGRFAPFNGLLMLSERSTVLCIFYLVGLIFFMKKSNQIRLGVFSFGLLLSVFLVRTPWPQYFMLAIPLIAITSAHAIHSVFKNNKALLFAFLIFSIGFQLPWLAQGARNSNGEQLKKIQYVLSITRTNDFVYDGDMQFNVYRKDIDFFWYSIDPLMGTLGTFQTMSHYK